MKIALYKNSRINYVAGDSCKYSSPFTPCKTPLCRVQEQELFHFLSILLGLSLLSFILTIYNIKVTVV